MHSVIIPDVGIEGDQSIVFLTSSKEIIILYFLNVSLVNIYRQN